MNSENIGGHCEQPVSGSSLKCPHPVVQCWFLFLDGSGSWRCFWSLVTSSPPDSNPLGQRLGLQVYSRHASFFGTQWQFSYWSAFQPQLDHLLEHKFLVPFFLIFGQVYLTVEPIVFILVSCQKVITLQTRDINSPLHIPNLPRQDIIRKSFNTFALISLLENTSIYLTKEA